MSWYRFAPKAYTRAHLVLIQLLQKRHIPFKTEEWVEANGRLYRVDILVAHKVVVEVDGKSHLKSRRQRKDRRKDRDLLAAGYEVLHLSDREVLRAPEKAFDKIFWKLVEAGD